MLVSITTRPAWIGSAHPVGWVMGKGFGSGGMQQVRDGRVVGLKIGIGTGDFGICDPSRRDGCSSLTGLCQGWGVDREDDDNVVFVIFAKALILPSVYE
jgi:hypothetical protein